MIIDKLENMFRGWFVGNFEPSIYKTDKFEVAILFHPKGEKWPKHYHKEAVEINVLLSGRMIINGESLIPGNIFLIQKNEVVEPEFLEDCTIVCVKSPSIPGDKYEVKE
jgi:mannose-6-phosphate isomerase-like protein (cupin superfamily)